MALVRIHVNQHVIKRNKKTGEREPPLTVKRARENHLTDHVNIGPIRIVYRPDHPLPCGATVWIEFDDREMYEKGFPLTYCPR